MRLFNNAGALTPWRTFHETGNASSIAYWFNEAYSTFSIPIAAIDDAGIVGAITGNYFGPDGAEIGGVFDIAGGVDGTPSAETAAGAFVGGRQP